MSVKNIYQAVYETRGMSVHDAQEALGFGDLQGVISRREEVEKFLEHNDWNLEEFKNYKVKLPPKRVMAKNAVVALGHAIRTKGKKVSAVERLERLSICDSCEWISRKAFRCVKCGCYANYKSRLAAWKCPIGKW